MYGTKKTKSINAEKWTPYEVFDWIAETATHNGLIFNTFNAKKYKYTNGKSFKKMTLGTFCDLAQSREAGLIMFQAKQNLFDQRNTVGRPRKKPNDDPEIKEKPYGKIWEFISKLLTNKDTCPSLVKWDDYNAGTFKFVQRKKVAELWGLRNNNTEMDYTTFTRALRYHYKKGFLISDRKRLVYKFGPKAIEFRNKLQNMSVPPKAIYSTV